VSHKNRLPRTRIERDCFRSSLTERAQKQLFYATTKVWQSYTSTEPTRCGPLKLHNKPDEQGRGRRRRKKTTINHMFVSSMSKSDRGGGRYVESNRIGRDTTGKKMHIVGQQSQSFAPAPRFAASTAPSTVSLRIVEVDRRRLRGTIRKGDRATFVSRNALDVGSHTLQSQNQTPQSLDGKHGKMARVCLPQRPLSTLPIRPKRELSHAGLPRCPSEPTV
jgi:hypothetical protein